MWATCQFWTQLQFDSAQPPQSTYPFSVWNQDDITANDHPNWALLQPALLNGFRIIYRQYSPSIAFISSGYRSPKVQQKLGSTKDYHVKGLAVDVSAGTETVCETLHDIGKTGTVHACVEPWQDQAKYNKAGKLTNNPYNHTHFGWRDTKCPSPDHNGDDW